MKKLGQFDWVEVIKKLGDHREMLSKYVSALRGPDIQYDDELGTLIMALKSYFTTLLRGYRWDNGFSWVKVPSRHVLYIINFISSLDEKSFNDNISHYIWHIVEGLVALGTVLNDERYVYIANVLNCSKVGIIRAFERLYCYLKAEEEEENEVPKNK